ncbi:MAG: T9SS type A sorting domain-containing protein [Bacteroidia bacterium]|nr:T9SS type A sorting domain-containing protein [Bacteroidia bacterium]
MKTIPKLLRNVLATIVATLVIIPAFGQVPDLTLDYNGTALVPGSSITVPLMLDGNVAISTMTLNITYNTDYLTFDNATNVWAVASLPGNAWSAAFNASTGKLVIYFEDFANFGSYPYYNNQLICDLNFTFNGGSGNITFDQANCDLSDEFLSSYTTVTYNDGSYAGDFGAIVSTGTGDWGTAGNWDLNKVPTSAYNVSIGNGTFITVAADASSNNLTVNPTGKLTLSSGQALAVDGSFLVSSDATGSGSFIDWGTFTVAGTNTVNRYMTGNWSGGPPVGSTIWHYVSSPITGATINTFFGQLMNKWTETINKWDSLTTPTYTPMVVGTGYAVARTSAGTATYTGTLNTGTIGPIALTRTPGAGNGWNLMGNPYPSAVDWTQLSRSQVDNAVYVWSGFLYKSYVGGVGSFDGIIPPEQGFFVKVGDAYTSGTVTFPFTCRTHYNGYYKETINEVLTLTMSGNGFDDQTFVRFTSEASAGFDSEYDAYKLFGMEQVPQLYSITPGKILSVNALPDVSLHPVVPMGCKVGVAGDYTITATGIETFPGETNMYIEDLLTGATQDLVSNPLYTFAATPGDKEYRFNLHFAPVGVPEKGGSAIRIYSADETIYVNVPVEINGTVFVYDMLGKEILSKSLISNSLNKINPDVPGGYYLVKVVGNNEAVSGKVFLK